MKIGSIDILKAYLGALELVSSNAFIGTIPIISGGPTPPVGPYEGVKLTALEDGCTVQLVPSQGVLDVPDVKISLDEGDTWTEYDWTKITLDQFETLCVKGNNTTGWNHPTNPGSAVTDWYTNFETTGRLKLSGNIMSLIDNGACTTTVIPCDNCFDSLFKSSSIVDIEEFELPATTLTLGCYRYLFRESAVENTMIELPATTMKPYCYNAMFNKCYSLTTNLLERLPATTLANNCYTTMFRGTLIDVAPILPANVLAPNCYQSMFMECTNLNYIKCLATTGTTGSSTNGWVRNVAATGTFVKAENVSWGTGQNGIPTGWTVETEGEFKGLKFTSTGNSTVELAQVGSAPAVDLKYSLDDGETWVQWDFSVISLSDGDSVCFKGLNTTFATDAGTYNKFVMTGSIAASGNIMSIIDNGACTTTTIPAIYCFHYLFYYCQSLTTAPALPATTLKEACYDGMFTMCKLLTTAPALPATTLATYCYSGMFNSCQSLTTAPALPATTLKQYCYQYMFSGCTSLTSAPELPATTLADWCYNNMFSSCTSLTTAPVLPAPTLSTRCYFNIFNGCTNLNYIKCLATNISASKCTQYWVSGVAASGTFVKKSSMTSWSTGTSGIPSGWTVKAA